MKKLSALIIAAVILACSMISPASCGWSLELLSVEEAARPEGKTFGFSESLRSDGPEISASNIEIAAGQGSFPLAIGFAPNGGSGVDLGTVRLECLKSTPIDLTPRVRPYVRKSGIWIESVSLPPGLYRFRVAIGDLDGKFSEKEFTVKVSVLF